MPLVGFLDKPPGPLLRVCVLGLLLCHSCHDREPLVVSGVSHVGVALDARPGLSPRACALGLLPCWPSVVGFNLWCPGIPHLVLFGCVAWASAVLFVFFFWAVPLVGFLDKPPGPLLRVCILGLLLCHHCHDGVLLVVSGVSRVGVALDARPGFSLRVCALALLPCWPSVVGFNLWCPGIPHLVLFGCVTWASAVLFVFFFWAVPLVGFLAKDSLLTDCLVVCHQTPRQYFDYLSQKRICHF